MAVEAKTLLSAFANKLALDDPSKCSLYYLDSESKRINFRLDLAKHAGELVNLINDHGEWFNLYYNYSKKVTSKLAVQLTFNPNGYQHDTDNEVEYDDCHSDASSVGSQASASASTSTRRKQCSAGEMRFMEKACFSLLTPLLTDKGDEHVLKDIERLAGASPFTEHLHDAVFAFPSAWLTPSDLHKLSVIFKWHPEFKNKLRVFWDDLNSVPFPRFMPQGKFCVNVESFRRCFLVQLKTRPSTVSLSQQGVLAYNVAQKKLDEWKASKAAENVAYHQKHGDPVNSESVVDLYNFDLLNRQYLRDIFNPERPEAAIYYLNMFFADVGELVYEKKIHEFTGTPILVSRQKPTIKMVYSDLEYTYEREDPVTGRTAVKTGHILDFYLRHKDHFNYHNTVFSPGHPTAYVTTLPGQKRKDIYAGDIRKLNTCPASSYTANKQFYCDDFGNPVKLIPKEGNPNPGNPNFDFMRYFGRERGEPLIDTFLRRMGHLPTSQDISHLDTEAWEEQVEREGPDVQLWLMMFHTYFVYAKRDMSLFDRYHAFFARALFNPMGKDKQFLVLSGQMGAGKTQITDCIGKFLFGLGTQYMYCGGDSERLVGRFTGQFENAILVCLDESSFAGSDPATANKLKSLCTDGLRQLEKKHQEARIIPNYLHVIIITNDLIGICVIDPGDRRYIVMEIDDELAVTAIYHAILQPRVCTRYFNMVYGRWLESQARLLDNKVIDFFRAPPFTAAKSRCVLTGLQTRMPQATWWHACLFLQKQIIGLKVDSHAFRNLMLYTKDIAWVASMEERLRKNGKVFMDMPDTTCELEEAKIKRKCADGDADYQWAKNVDDPKWAKFRYSYGGDDALWPYTTTIKDLYYAYCANQGKKAEYIMMTEFKQKLKSVLTFAPFKGAPNQDDEPIKIPCLYGCRAQFTYFLKYNCIRDKHGGLIQAYGTEHDPEWDAAPAAKPQKRGTTGTRGDSPGEDGGRRQGDQELPAQAPAQQAPGSVNPDSGARPGGHGAGQGQRRSGETWIDILWQQCRADKRPKGFHRYCKQCRQCSELWREIEQEHRVKDGLRLDDTVQGPGAQAGPGAASQAGADGLCEGDHERRAGQRARDSQGSQPDIKGKGRDDGGSPGLALARVQSGRAGSREPGGARVQDSSDEEDTADDSDGDRPCPLLAGSDESPLLSAPRYSQVDSDVQCSPDPAASPVLYHLRQGSDDNDSA